MQEQDRGSDLEEVELKLGLFILLPRVFLKHVENSNFFFLVLFDVVVEGNLLAWLQS